MRTSVIALSDFSDHKKQLARNLLLESLSQDGFCFVESNGSSQDILGLLSELSNFFIAAGDREKEQLKAYRCGYLCGYFPPIEPLSRKLELRKERYVFGSGNNLYPGNYPLIRHQYCRLFQRHIQCIAEAVHTSVHSYLEEANPQWAQTFRKFFLNPHSGELEPSVLSYAMHYPPVHNPEDFLNPDQTVTVSDPHVDMTTFTILPRGIGGSTKMFDQSGKIVPIYDSSVSSDAILVFAGKTLEKLLEGIPFRNKNGSFPFRAFRHAVMNTPEEVSKHRDVVGYFFNGNPGGQYLTVADGKEFGSMFIDRRPSIMKQREPLSQATLTVKDRQYLTERLFFSETSLNSASPSITLEQFRYVN